MIAAKPIALKARLKDYLDSAFNGDPVIISRKNNSNGILEILSCKGHYEA